MEDKDRKFIRECDDQAFCYCRKIRKPCHRGQTGGGQRHRLPICPQMGCGGENFVLLWFKKESWPRRPCGGMIGQYIRAQEFLPGTGEGLGKVGGQP